MWTTVSMRIRGAKAQLQEAGEETDDMVESTSKLRELVKGITGFDIMKDEENFKDMMDIIIGIGEQWNKINDIDQAALLEALAGKNRSNALAAALSNVDMIKKAYQTATASAGSAAKEQERYEQSVAYSVGRFKASIQELSHDAIDSGVLKFFVDLGRTGVEALDGLVDRIGFLKTALVGILSVYTAKNGGNNPFVGIARDALNLWNKPVEASFTTDQVEKVQNKASMLIGAVKPTDDLSMLSKNVDEAAKSFKNLEQADIEAAKAALAENKALAGTQGASVSSSAALKGLSAATKETTLGAKLLKFTWEGLKTTLATVGWGLVFTGISWGIEELMKFVDQIHVTKEESAQAFESFKSTTANVEDLSSKLSDINNKIDTIKSKGTLSLVDKEELDALEKEKENLELQITLAKINAGKDAKTAYEGLEAGKRERKRFASHEIEYISNSDYVRENGKVNYSIIDAKDGHPTVKYDHATTKYMGVDEEIENAIAYYKAAKEGLADAKAKLAKLDVTKDSAKIMSLENKISSYTDNITEAENRIADAVNEANNTVNVSKAYDAIFGLDDSGKEKLDEANKAISLYKEYNDYKFEKVASTTEKIEKQYGDKLKEIQNRSQAVAETVGTVQSAYTELNSIIHETNSGVNVTLSQEQMNKYASAVEYVNGVYKISADKAKVLSEQVNKAALAQVKHNKSLDKNLYIKNKQKIDELSEAIEKFGNNQNDQITNAKREIEALQRENNQITANIMSYNMQITKLNELSSAYKAWVNASSESIDADTFTNLGKAADQVLESLKNGKVGDVYKAALDAIVPNADEKTHAQIKKYVEGIKKYFTEDSKGLKKFVEDSMKKTGESGAKLMVKTADGYAIGDGITLKDFTEQLNITKDVARSLFDELQHTYGWTFEWGNESPEDITDKLIKLNNTIKETQKEYDSEVKSFTSNQLTNLVKQKGELKARGEQTPVALEEALNYVSKLQFETDPDKILGWLDALERTGYVSKDSTEDLLKLAEAMSKANQEYSSFNKTLNDDVSMKYEENIEKIRKFYSLIEKFSEYHDSPFSKEDLEMFDSLSKEYGIKIDASNAQEAITQLAVAISKLTGAENIIDIKAYTEQADTAINKLKSELASIDKQIEKEKNRWSKLIYEKDKEGEEITGDERVQHYDIIHGLGEQKSKKQRELKSKEEQKEVIEKILKINTEDPSIEETRKKLEDLQNFKIDEKEVPVDYSKVTEAQTAIDDLKKDILSLNDIKATVSATTVKEEKTEKSGFFSRFIPRASNASGGKSDGGTTLVGEQGTELVVDPNSKSWYTVGDHGSEFIDLPKDAIVYTASQTKQLLSSGKTGRGKSTGKSFASGSAYSSSNNNAGAIKAHGGNFIIDASSDDKTSKTAKDNAKDTTKETDKQKQNIEWIENAINRIKSQVESMADIANDEDRTLEDRIHSAEQLTSLLREQEQLLSTAFERRSEDYKEQYEKLKGLVGEEQAKDYVDKILKGRISANDWKEYFESEEKKDSNTQTKYEAVTELAKKYEALQNIESQLKDNNAKSVDYAIKAVDLRKKASEEIRDNENTSYDKRIEAARDAIEYDRQERDILDGNIAEIELRKQAIINALNSQMDPAIVQAFINQLKDGATSITEMYAQAEAGINGLSIEQVNYFRDYMDSDAEESYFKEKRKKTMDEIANDIKKLYDVRINKIKAEVEEVSDFIKELNDEMDYKETVGKMIVEGDYLSLIEASKRQVEAYTDQLEILEEELDDLEDENLEGSQAWLDVRKQINEVESSIRDAKKQQAEWNETMLRLPIQRVEKYLALLENINKDIANFVDLETSLGKAKTVNQIQDVIKVAQEKIKAYKEDIESYQKLLKNYEFGSTKFTETADAIQECEDNLADMVEQIQNANTELLNLPIDKLNKLVDSAQKLKDSIDKLLGEYNDVLSGVDSYYNKIIEDQNEVYDDQIKKLQDQLDLLNKQNDARKAELAIEQAKFNLDKARTQLTNQVVRNGELIWEADQEQVRNAQNELTDATYNKLQHDLQAKIDELNKAKSDFDEDMEDRRKMWQQIATDAANNKAWEKVTEYLGKNWQEKVSTKTDDELRNKFESAYNVSFNQSSLLEKQIDQNQTIINLMSQLVTEYNEGNKTYEQVVQEFKNIEKLAKDGFTAMENVNSQIAINGAKTVEAVSNGLAQMTAAEYKNFLENLSLVNTNNEAVKAYKEEIQKISESTDAQIEAAKQMKEAADKIAEASKKIINYYDGYESDDDDGGSGGSSRSSGGHSSGWSYSDYDGPSSASDAGVKGNERENTEGHSTREKHYKTGLAQGIVGNVTPDDKFKMLQSMGLKPLEPDEIPAVLHVGEGVVNPSQMDNIFSTMKNAYTAGLNAINPVQAATVNIQMGDLNLPNVTNGEQFAKSLAQNFEPVMNQYFSKIFK